MSGLKGSPRLLTTSEAHWTFAGNSAEEFVEEIELSWQEFTDLRMFKKKRYREWLAVFSTNCREDIWWPKTEGYTQPEDRTELRGISRAVDRISEALLRVRPEGGRIFVDERGGFYKDKSGRLQQFVCFKGR